MQELCAVSGLNSDLAGNRDEDEGETHGALSSPKAHEQGKICRTVVAKDVPNTDEKKDRTESRLVATRHTSEPVQDGAYPVKRKEQDASMAYEEAMLWKMLKVLMDERLSAPRPGEQVKTQGGWTLRCPLRTQIERG